MRTHIEQISLRPVATTVQNDYAFTLRKDRKHMWLQRICVWIMKRLECYQCTETYTIERHCIDGKLFFKKLLEMRIDLVKHLDREPHMLLIGAEDIAVLMDEAHATREYGFHFQYYREGRIFDTQVRVIPWMRGAVWL